MKKISIIVLLALVSFSSNAGNIDRAGTAGAQQLLINPWARSSGLGNTSSSFITGIEASYFNIAGLAHTRSTEVIFSRMNYVAGISSNSIGFSQKMGSGSSGVLGLSINTFNSGEIIRTTVEQPDGGLGTYSVQFLDLGLSYAKKFSEQISGGLMAKVISQGTADAKASGLAIDAGVQYRTSLNKNKKIKGQDFKIGISVRNIGPDISFRGDALSVRAIPDGGSYSSTVEQRSAGANLPSLVNMAAAYDFRLDGNKDSYFHRLTVAANFTSHSFSADQSGLGLEYSYKDLLMFRGAFVYEDGIFGDRTVRNTFFTGYNFGASFQIPFGTNKSTFAIDYSYRTTDLLGGVHTFGGRINL